MPDNVSQVALEWSLAHIERYGDTDIFPIPFEYEVIRAHWTPLLSYLGGIDMEAHELSPAAKLMMPKTGGGYRAATQLDPLDSLLLTAALYEGATQIENFRKPRVERVACAFRVEADATGKLAKTM